MEKKILAIFMSLLLAVIFGAPFVVTAANSGGATLIMGTTDSVESAIDPAQAYDFLGWEIIQNTGCGLVETEPGTGDIVPSLALNWEVSGDGLTWNFTLRQGVKFDDGTEFNASHVKYSFDRSMGIASPDGPQYNMGYSDIIDNVEVVSKYVVRFNLRIPFAPFLRLMACQASYIVNPKYAPIDQIVWYTEGDARASSSMDLGPYVLTKWERVAGKDHEMILEANPNYWNRDAGLPKTEKIIIKFYADPTSLRLAIEAGDIDIAFRHLSATDIEDLQEDPDVKVWQGTGAAIQYMIFQEDPVGTLPQLNDARIRRALTACLDRPEVCSTVFLGQASPLYSMIPTGMMGHTEAFKVLGDANYTYARSLLADLGYNETNKLEIELWYETSGHYPSSPEQAALYKTQFEASGVILVTLHGADWPSYRENRNDGTMHVFIYGWYPDYIDPDNYAFLYYAVWLNHHYIDHGEHYAEMKAAYDAARASSVESERITLYAEIDDYAVMDCPVVPIWQGAAWAVTKPDVEGVYLDITQFLRMWYLYWTIRSFDIPWNGETYRVTTFSSSTITDFNFSQPDKQISFNVSGPYGTTGFCNVTIPNELLGGPYTVLVDNSSVTPDPIWTWNDTHSFVYFTYNHSTRIVGIIGTTVIPEFPSAIILSLFIIATLVTVILGKTIQSRSTYKRNHRRKRKPISSLFFIKSPTLFPPYS